MLAIISPAKTLDYKTPYLDCSPTEPDYLTKSAELVDICRELTPPELASLMHISDKLAALNVARFTEWQLPQPAENIRPAIFAFKGDVYTGLDAFSLDEQAINFAQKHLRMLSGLYGILRPLDLMQPYRLEMGTKLANPAGKNLYEFWGDTLTQGLNQALAEQGDDVLVNLASDEYWNVIQPTDIKGKIIKPIFLDYKNGRYKVISFYAKKARGMMCRYIIENQLTYAEQLKDFDSAGYAFCPAESTDKEWVFKRHLAE